MSSSWEEIVRVYDRSFADVLDDELLSKVDFSRDGQLTIINDKHRLLLEACLLLRIDQEWALVTLIGNQMHGNVLKSRFFNLIGRQIVNLLQATDEEHFEFVIITTHDVRHHVLLEPAIGCSETWEVIGLKFGALTVHFSLYGCCSLAAKDNGHFAENVTWLKLLWSFIFCLDWLLINWIIGIDRFLTFFHCKHGSLDFIFAVNNEINACIWKELIIRVQDVLIGCNKLLTWRSQDDFKLINKLEDKLFVFIWMDQRCSVQFFMKFFSFCSFILIFLYIV